MRPLRNDWFVVLLMTFACAFAYAVWFVVVMTFALPKSDGAYGSKPFADPMVLPIMSVFATAGAIVAYPGVYFAVRHRKLWWCFPAMLGIVVVEITVITPINAALGFLGSFVALAGALALCFLRAPKLTRPDECAHCGYPIGTSALCTECGKPVKSAKLKVED